MKITLCENGFLFRYRSLVQHVVDKMGDHCMDPETLFFPEQLLFIPRLVVSCLLSGGLDGKETILQDLGLVEEFRKAKH